MTTWSFYDSESGEFSGADFDGPEEYLAGATPAGCGAMPGKYDRKRQRVDTVSGLVVDRTPPKPADTEDAIYEWSAAADDWLKRPTPAKVAKDARGRRAQLLADCDWVSLRAADTGQPPPTAWMAYRQALRDITDQPGFPDDITWPQPPVA